MGHEGPSHSSIPNLKWIKWKNKGARSNPLIVIAANDPVSCAIYVKNNSLFGKDR